jgi:hypothetical protein
MHDACLNKTINVNTLCHFASVMFSSEFVAVMVGNYLQDKYFEDTNDFLCHIVDSVICLVDRTVLQHVLSGEDLIKACFDIDYFGEVLERELDCSLSWNTFVYVCVLLKAVVLELSKYNVEGYYHLVKVQDILQKYKYNYWVAKQPGNWKSFVHHVN